ncbi:MAG TPA: conjugal transfer protein [Streptosporangiaceae bacterium]|nr:conjugal transfer protein [Streptosporangiaceae bacterium]
MARRSTLERSPQLTVHGADYARGDLAQGAMAGSNHASVRWRGAGGRWLVWVMRGVLWVVLLLIGYRGVMAIVLNETPPSTGHHTARPPAGPKFPTAMASAFALQFAQVYLNASPATAGQRSSQLAQFLPPGSSLNLGSSGTGTLTLQSEQVAGVQVRDSHNAVVLVLARVNNKLMELGVPVYTAAGGMTVSGEPAFLPPPPTAVPPTSATPPATDQVTQATLMTQLPVFFKAYASGDETTLARFVAPGAVVTGLGRDVTFVSLSGVTVPPGGTTRHVVATVVWQVLGQPAVRARGRARTTVVQLEMSYELTVVKQGGTWYVQSISPSSLPAGQP